MNSLFILMDSQDAIENITFLREVIELVYLLANTEKD